jgi:hypothetical protein
MPTNTTCYNCIDLQHKIIDFKLTKNGGNEITLADGGRICNSIKLNNWGQTTHMIIIIPPKINSF